MSLITRQSCAELDNCDPLAPLREQFDLPPGMLYLDGNSLGALPRSTAARVQQVIQQEWGQGLIQSWNQAGWMALPQRVGDKIARLIGAQKLSARVGIQAIPMAAQCRGSAGD